MTLINRRTFQTSTAAGVATISATSMAASAVLGANDRVRIGFIGLGNRGDQVLDAFLEHKDCEVVAICDIHQPYLDFASKKIGSNPAQYRDYKKLLDHAKLDAVVIATPDHWHALQMIHACQAGKDVYVEKPLSLCVAEGRRMVEAARHHLLSNILQSINHLQDSCWLFRNSITTQFIFNWSNHFFHLLRFFGIGLIGLL